MSGEGKKPVYKRVWFWILIVVVVIVIAAVGSGGSSDTESTESESSSTSSTQAESAQDESADEVEDYTIDDVEYDDSDGYYGYIRGSFTNNTDKEFSYVQLTYVLYDSDGAQIDTAYANTNDLKAGGTWKFEAVSTADIDEVDSYELSDVSYY